MHLSVIGQLSPKVGLFNIFSSTPSNHLRHTVAFNRVTLALESQIWICD